MAIRLFPLPEAESGQLSRRHQQRRQGVGHILRRAAVGDEQIIDGVEGDGRAQEAAGACDLQPRPLTIKPQITCMAPVPKPRKKMKEKRSAPFWIR